MAKEIKRVGMGLCWDELAVGDRFLTAGRTLTETDLVNFVNFSWINEELFTNVEDRQDMAIKGRVVPGALVYCCAEGLLLPIVRGTGLAFLNAAIDVKRPAFVGDTIHVECTVTEARKTSKDSRGLVRTDNNVVNQNGEAVICYSAQRIMKGRSG
jgi:acyl dehydratase